MAGPAVLREVTLALPMVADMEIAATKTVTSLAEFMKMSPDKVDEIRLAVVEACINAFEYSHAPDGMVHLTFSVLGEREPETLRVTVRDHGVGFDPASPLRSPKHRGHGLKIIRGLMDEVTIHSGGNGTTVVMSKAR